MTEFCFVLVRDPPGLKAALPGDPGKLSMKKRPVNIGSASVLISSVFAELAIGNIDGARFW